jgi:biopolymer transport protein ExbB
MPEHDAHMVLLVYFQQGGMAMYPLLLCSVLTLGVAVERILHLARAARQDAVLLPRLAPLAAGGEAAAAAEHCATGAGPLARIMAAVLASAKGRAHAREKTIERVVARETAALERYLPVLATIGSVSPFVGLFGTVLGIMRAFRDMGLAGSAGGAIVAAGIAEALIATATGLIVAVIAVVAYNHLMTWAEAIGSNAELNAEELLTQLDEQEAA